MDSASAEEIRPRLSEAELSDFLKRLAQNAADGDLTGADMAIKELQAKAVPAGMRPLVDSLAAAVENIDFDQLADIVKSARPASPSVPDSHTLN